MNDKPEIAGMLNGEPISPRVESLIEQLSMVARTSALEEMASGIAHEINQPLGAIATFAQAGERMLGRPEPMLGQTRDVLQHISNEALKASDGIKRMRALFTHSDAPKTLCSMADIVHELQPVLAFSAARVRVVVEYSFSENLPPIFVDRLRIQHVLFTLVQNALEESKANASTVPIRIHVVGDRYGVETSVTDSGQGIKASLRTQIFSPFFTTKTRGTGLGLASSRSIIESHAGTIGFDDAPGGGCKFWFRLPAAT